MMKEEKILKDKLGNANPFKVPEGFFDAFADQLMDRLPEADARVIEMRPESWWHRMPLRKIAAVVGAAAVLAGGGVLYSHHASSSVSVAHATEQPAVENGSEYGTFDQMADYTMIDNQDIYASLASDNQGGM